MSKEAALIAAGAAVIIALAKESAAAGGSCARLTIEQVRQICEGTCAQHFPAVDPLMLRAMVEVESSRFPCALRDEPQISDASMGLMQTLLHSNALWLYNDMGARAMGEPSFESLRIPEVSVYFGGAYVNFLRRYQGHARSEEQIVRDYNGGPGRGSRIGATLHHWDKYQAAKSRLIDHDLGIGSA